MNLPIALSEVDLKATMALTHSIYWLLVVNGSAVRRKRNETLETSENSQSSTVATKRATTNSAAAALMSTAITYGMFYILLDIWWFKPEWLGKLVLPVSLPIQLAGLAIILISMGVKVWSFWAFKSWRLFPQIDPGHQLVTSGPYRWVRHPLYFAIQLLYLGSFLMLPYLGFLLQFVANFLSHNFRCSIEESVLIEAFGDTYREYMQKAHRLIPSVF